MLLLRNCDNFLCVDVFFVNASHFSRLSEQQRDTRGSAAPKDGMASGRRTSASEGRAPTGRRVTLVPRSEAKGLIQGLEKRPMVESEGHEFPIEGGKDLIFHRRDSVPILSWVYFFARELATIEPR